MPLPVIGVCQRCGRQFATADGILDFVGGRFETKLDVASYDREVGDDAAERAYYRMKDIAAERWPASLGSVVEIGCGTPDCSRVTCHLPCCGCAEGILSWTRRNTAAAVRHLQRARSMLP